MESERKIKMDTIMQAGCYDKGSNSWLVCDTCKGSDSCKARRIATEKFYANADYDTIMAMCRGGIAIL